MRGSVPPRRTTKPFRLATTIEREFLRIVTFGHPELECQIESCEIAEYDVTGWCDVNVLAGPPSPHDMIDGPGVDFTEIENATFEIAKPDVAPMTFSVSKGKVVKLAPRVLLDAPHVYRIETILWMSEDGLLYTVEVMSIGDGYIVDPYRLFVEVSRSEPNRLHYPTNERR